MRYTTCFSPHGYKELIHRLSLAFKTLSNPNTSKTIQFSFLGSLALVMRDLFDIPDDVEVRLWNKYMSNAYEQLNRHEHTLQEVGLYSGQIVIIEERNKDGTWPRGGNGEGFVQ